MIRLGSLAGYAFEGPRMLAGFTPPERPAVYAILYKPEPDTKPERYGVLYVGHSDDLSRERLPFRHPLAPCWLKRVDDDKFKLHICFLEAPGAVEAHREQITRELVSIYEPGCNPERYDQTWREQWIGDYRAPTTGPLTTERSPSEGKRR
ncbi:MAG TPA: hypothetical protein VMP13_05735 [Acidimicrobiia bacterium]|nr:hypothetical protein [Acidimicrobiia bacterium]